MRLTPLRAGATDHLLIEKRHHPRIVHGQPPPLKTTTARPPARMASCTVHAEPCGAPPAAPDRSVHRAYGLPAVERTREMVAHATQQANEALREDPAIISAR
jgi:hypothetical protein